MSKRVFDIVAASAGLLACTPCMACIALALACERRGPIFYVTRRAGRQGHVFRLYRFRTMVEGGPEPPVTDRLTRVGRFIRNYSLDDLPQLFNVLKGDVSIIGPRPFLVDEVELSEPAWQRILSVRPRLISFAILSLRGDYNGASLEAKQELELETSAGRRYGSICGYLGRRCGPWSGVVAM